MKTIRVLSRDSALAVRQAELVIDAIHRYDAALQTELITMKTTGDIILDRSLDEIGGKGLFVKELDAALLAGAGDISVHSCKDLPLGENPELPLVAFSEREDARDALVLPFGVSELDAAKPIGCSSARRAAQLKLLYPNMRVAPVRGNVPTRLRKLDGGEYSALVLAAAGLKRLGLEARISRVFTAEEMLPAACQGIIAVQARANADTEFLRLFRSAESELCARAERAFTAALGADCSAPVAAYARRDGDEYKISGMFVGADGVPRFNGVSAGADELTAAAVELARGFLNG
ncbi:MAG: hydroxymethylbilane synthase [Oscillospiraceae bacterium]|jgi:hydroxymethylbilane synthase|nr:hydroxymethylbilane synthase [Oscillospiraceae bacterium]